MPFNNFLSQRYLEHARKEQSIIEYGEHLVRTASINSFRTTESGNESGNGSGNGSGLAGKKSLREKLEEIRLSEKGNSEFPEFKVNLLHRLIEKEQLNRVILNLYPGDYGFTVEISGREISSPPIVLPYEDPWLESLESGELHPAVADLLVDADVFYDGCVIVEVRDYRRIDLSVIESNACVCNPHYVVLKPTTQTLVSDLSMLASKNKELSYADLQALESTLLCVISEPLCLDPSPSVAIVANRIQYNKNSLYRSSLKRMAKKHSQITVNKRKRLEDVPLPSNLQICEYLSKRKKNFAKPVPSKVCFPCELELPERENYDFLLEDLNICRLPSDAGVSSYSAENQKCIKIKRDPGGIRCAKISVKEVTEVPEDRCFEVTQYLSCNGQDDYEHGPSFKLRSKELVDKYIDQFTETFTEKGKLTIENVDSEQKDSHSSIVQALPGSIFMSNLLPTKVPSVFTEESTTSSSSPSHHSAIIF